MKLLIIEDNEHMIGALRKSLRTIFVIDVARSAADGLHRAEMGSPDVIILDLGLPDGDGVTVCQALRARPGTPPILVLTARASIDTKVTLLDSGADDYLTKPFRLEELQARLRVLVRRKSGAARTSTLRAGELVLDSARRLVWHRGEAIALRRKEFDLLEYFMHHQGAAVTRSMIMDHVWAEGESLWTNAVDVHIKNLRDRIDRPYGTQLIQTVHGVGYRFTLPDALPVA